MKKTIRKKVKVSAWVKLNCDEVGAVVLIFVVPGSNPALNFQFF
jgi:hypothetical protein